MCTPSVWLCLFVCFDWFLKTDFKCSLLPEASHQFCRHLFRDLLVCFHLSRSKFYRKKKKRPERLNFSFSDTECKCLAQAPCWWHGLLDFWNQSMKSLLCLLSLLASARVSSSGFLWLSVSIPAAFTELLSDRQSLIRAIASVKSTEKYDGILHSF